MKSYFYQIYKIIFILLLTNISSLYAHNLFNGGCKEHCGQKVKVTNNNLICGLCGEELVKKPSIRLKQIIALIAASSLLLPIIYTFIFLIKNQINTPNKNYQANRNLMIIIKETLS